MGSSWCILYDAIMFLLHDGKWRDKWIIQIHHKFYSENIYGGLRGLINWITIYVRFLIVDTSIVAWKFSKYFPSLHTFWCTLKIYDCFVFRALFRAFLEFLTVLYNLWRTKKWRTHIISVKIDQLTHDWFVFQTIAFLDNFSSVHQKQ